MGKVIVNNREVDFDAAHNLMDDEICNELSSKLAPCGEQEFVDAYVEAHAAKFDGEVFRVD